MSKCEHSGPIWQPEYCNEAGWFCPDCRTILGYRPDLDRAALEEKIRALLLELHEHKLLYVSNGTMGDVIIGNVAQACRQAEVYDQYSILRSILVDPNLQRHAQFWAARAEGWLRILSVRNSPNSRPEGGDSPCSSSTTSSGIHGSRPSAASSGTAAPRCFGLSA